VVCPGLGGQKLKVLIIDDDPDVRRIARLCLSQLGGMDVVEASSADEGLRRAAADKPDVILLDIMMPRVDGLAAIGSLRRVPETARIPVIFLTARTGEDDESFLRRTGARGLLTKPFDPMTLATKVRSLLET
jgi:CheY-like chemotaxis protein